MLEDKYAKKEDIPKGYAYLYTEKNGEFVLKSMSEVKSENDVKNVQTALQNERNAHSETQAKLKPFEKLGDPAKVQEELDKIPELEAAASGGSDEDKIKDRVNARLEAEKKPLERQIETLTSERDTATAQVTTLTTQNDTRFIEDAIRKAGIGFKLSEGGINDALMRSSLFEIQGEGADRKAVTKDGQGVVAGLDATSWLTDLGDSIDHWRQGSNGSGSRGTNGATGSVKNPYSHEHWNMTEQGKLYQSNPEQAQKLAEAAGTTAIGAKQPPAPK